MAKKVSCEPGDWISIPIEHGFAVALIVASGSQGVLVGYVFDKSYDTVPDLSLLGSLTPDDAWQAQRFGDLYLINGRWGVIGRHPGWDRNPWNVPEFGEARYPESSVRVRYLPNLIQHESEEPVSAEELAQLPKSALRGAGAVEALLNHHLGSVR